MTHQEDQAFNQLLRTWLQHEELRAQCAPIASLAASRSELDNARRRAFRTRTVAVSGTATVRNRTL